MEPHVIKLSKCSLTSNLDDIREAVEANGFCVLEPWDASPDTFRTIGSIFGKIQSHIRADEEGIVGVGGEQPQGEWKEYISEYKGLGMAQFEPHTDGTFVDGFITRGNRLKKARPPLYVILQVVRSARSGGANIIVDTQKILKHLLMNEPDMAATLMKSGCLTVIRDDQMAMDFPVFELIGYGHFRVRYRGDAKAFAPDWSLPSLRLLQTKYHLSHDFRTRVSLKENQILVADNTRVLHGREPFTNKNNGAGEGRKLRRIWILDENTPDIVSMTEEVPTSRVLDAFKPYGPVPNEMALKGVPKIATGIRLDCDAMKIAAMLIRNNIGQMLYPRHEVPPISTEIPNESHPVQLAWPVEKDFETASKL